MGKLYWECYSGISGDMVTGALLDLGAPEQELRKQLATLPLEGYTIEIKKEWKQGMAATFFHVDAEADPMVFSHEAHSKHGSAHTHTQGRTLPEIHGILEGSQLSPRAKQMAKEIFSILAQAEGGNPRPTGRPGGLAGSGSGGFHCGCGRRSYLRGFVGGG